MSAESNFTLTISDLRESDAKFYCCGNITDNPRRCWIYRTELRVADLQVQVIPTTEGQTVSMICSPSCPLTENSTVYIWYKNREFLYEDWSPWYQELVSSEEAVTYSCAIKGYEHLRAPEVSVDSVTPACFSVTYAKGRTCPPNQTSAVEPCSITYPTEVHVQRTPLDEEFVRLTCTPSCPLTDPQTAYRWYWQRPSVRRQNTKLLYRNFEGQNFTVPRGGDSFSCAVKGHEDLHSAQVCAEEKSCWDVNYVSRRICTLEGSSVNITSEYWHQDSWPPEFKLWYKVKRSGEENAEHLTASSDHLTYHDKMNKSHILRITNLRKNDSAEYIFSLQRKGEEWKLSDFSGVTLVVTGLKVKFTPSAEVTEGQRVTLTCSTSCPLTDNTNYIWFLNSRPLTLTETQTKHLVLDPVSSQHAGNYSCGIKTQRDITSPEETLTVQGPKTDVPMAIINAVRLTVALLIPIPLLLFHLWMSCFNISWDVYVVKMYFAAATDGHIQLGKIGAQGRANSICALKGSSVDLPCSAERPTSSMTWSTVHWDGSKYVQNELSADGVTYNMSAGSNFTLKIKNLTESDAKVYCCKETTSKPENCKQSPVQLRVADLQVKVIPTTEGQTVTLICSTSCPLTENPAVYIWYKNRELLYEDWSPWYHQLVSSEEAVTYSCAIKGYEHLRAPEVSVDSVTSTCFNVTYAKGRMCSYKHSPVDEPCTITYPREVHVQRTPAGSHVTLTCHTSCPVTARHTAYKGYKNRHAVESFSCAVKDHEDLRSAEVCVKDKNCWSVNYDSRRICALEGSSVNITSEYSYPDNQQPKAKLWYKIKRMGKKAAERLTEAAGRVEYHENKKNHHILRIKNLKRNDSAEYIFRLITNEGGWKQTGLSVVTLIVTDLKVKFTPSAVVTEGQRVTLTCSTSCPLTDNTNYIWFLNSRPLTLTETQTKHLVLDPASSQHAGNYSCGIKTQRDITSPEKTLTVQALTSIVVLNALKLTIVSLILPAVLLFYMVMRRRKTLSSATEQSDKARTGRADSLYERITFKTMNPAAPKEPPEHQEHTV
ncbi:hypothetical protein ABVT39_023145 [Epinephelus coioides]